MNADKTNKRKSFKITVWITVRFYPRKSASLRSAYFWLSASKKVFSPVLPSTGRSTASTGTAAASAEASAPAETAPAA